MLRKLAAKTVAAKARSIKALSAKSPQAGAIAAKSIHFGVQNRRIFFALIAVGIGVLIGLTAVRSRESLEVLSSSFVIGLFALIALYHPLGGFLIWVFLNTFIDSWVEIPLGRGIPDLSFGRFAVFSLAVSLLMRASTGTMRLIPLSGTDAFALLAPVGIALAAPLAVEPVAMIQTAISMYFIPLAGFILAKQLIRNRDHLFLLLGVVAFFGTVAGTHAIYEALTGNVIFIAKEQVVEQIPAQSRGDTNLRLIIGLVGETGSMGRVLAITLLVTLYYIMEDKNAYFKPFWMVGALLQFGGLVATFSRTPLLTFLVGLFILQFFYPVLRRLLIVLTIIIAVTLAMNWQRIQRTEAAQDRLSGIEDYNGRAFRWQAGFNMWLEKPIRGWGAGRFAQASGRYRADGARANVDAVENDYLRILVDTGLIGFLPYALFLLSTLWSSLQLFFRRKFLEPKSFIDSGAIALAWGVLACFLLSSFTAVNSFAITRLLPFVLLGALVGSHQYLLARGANRQWRLSPSTA